MKVLLAFFFRFLLAPVIAIILLFLINSITKIKKSLNLKKLIVFVLLSSLIFIIPSLFGLLRNEFVWGGLILTIISYIFLGIFYRYLLRSKFYSAIGLKNHPPAILLVMLISLILSAWIFYLIFSWLSKLPYSFWVMFTVIWAMVPVLYTISKTYFLKISNSFFKYWVVSGEDTSTEFWENRDTFKFMLITVKIKRKLNDKESASLSVRLPKEVSLGVWFDRFLEDQNVRFPQNIIETQKDGEDIGWIFYTSKWLRIPLFMKVLDPEKNSIENKIKNKRIIYIRRTTLKNKNDE